MIWTDLPCDCCCCAARETKHGKLTLVLLLLLFILVAHEDPHALPRVSAAHLHSTVGYNSDGIFCISYAASSYAMHKALQLLQQSTCPYHRVRVLVISTGSPTMPNILGRVGPDEVCSAHPTSRLTTASGRWPPAPVLMQLVR